MSDAGTKTIDNTTYYLFSYDINTCEKFKIGDSGADLDWEPKAPYTDGTDRYISVNHFHAFRSSNITVASGCFVYFDNSNAQWSDAHILFCEGHTSHSTNYSMSHLTNTNLWYISPNTNYNDAKYVGMMGNASSFNGNEWSVWNIKDANHYSDVLRYGMNSSRTYLISKANADNAGEISIDCDASHGNNGYGMLNHNQTIHVMLSTDGGSSYSDVTGNASDWHGTIQASRTYFTGNGVVTTVSDEVLSSSAYVKTAALTSTFSLTESATATGYTFEGFGNSASATPDGQTTYTLNNISGTNDIYAFFKAVGSALTFDHEGGSGGPTNRTMYYGTALAGITGSNFPTKADNGFDGFWTEDNGNGIQVIKEDGTVKSGVENYTDASGNWIRTSNTTLYARWMPVGYYVAGKFNNWVADPAYHKFDPSTLKASFGLLKKTFEDKDYKTQIKIRKVNAGSSSGPSNTWYGKGASDGAITMGKDNPKETGLSTSGSNIALEVNYDGTYEFTITEGSGVIDLEVAVPVVNRLEIYNINGATSGTVDGHTLPWLTDDWEDAGVANTVTKTVQLERGKYYDFKPVYDSYYYGKTPTANITYNATPPSVSDLVDKQNNLHITADLKGDYKFDFNTSSKTLTVTYPTRRQINYEAVTLRSGNGTASGANGSLSAENDSDGDYAVSTDGYVADGNSVTFRAPAAKTGYTWRGWFTKSDPSSLDDGKVSTDDELTYTVAVTGGNKTVYAIYSEDTHTITVDSTSNYTASGQYGGHVTYNSIKVTSAIANVGVSSYAELTAVPANDAWHFKEWRLSANATFAEGSSANSNPVHVNASADGQTVTAFFEPRFGLVGSRTTTDNPAEGMPNNGGTTWQNEYAADFVVNSFTGLGTDNGVDLQCVRTLYPNREYKFQVYDREKKTRRGFEFTSTLKSGANAQLDHSADVKINTVGYGTYTFKITKLTNDGNNYPSIEVDRQASQLVSMGWSYQNIGGELTSGDTGGTVSAHTDEGSAASLEGFDVANGQYAAVGCNITFTPDIATGYRLEGWYGNAGCTGTAFASSNPLIFEIKSDEAVNVYAKFVENSTAVTIAHNEHGYVQVDGVTATNTTVGVNTTRTITAVPKEGYYFAGWTVPAGADFTVEDATEAGNNDSKSTTLQGLGAGTAGTLTANFVELEKVYFRNWNAEENTPLWDNVYVYFTISYENDSQNQSCAKSNASNSYKALMKREGSSNNYWAYVPRGVTKNTEGNIAFSNHDFGTSFKFNNYEAVMRGDYRSNLSMFVPRHASTYTRNGTKYYGGYWKHHNLAVGTYSGYKIERYAGGDSYVEPADNGANRRDFIVADENTIQYTLRVDNLENDHNRFMIYSDGLVHYITYNTSATESGYDITTSNYSRVHLSEYNDGKPRFEIEPTSEGMYTLTIDMNGDEMLLSVDYPVAVGDYRLKHTYTIGGNTYTTYSDIIKGGATSTTASMYLNTEAGKSQTFTLGKCTAISPSIVWTQQGDNLWSSNSSHFTDGKGVYQFDIAIAEGTPSTISSITEAKPYEGNYYIKTDCAPGGWTAYKSNVLNKNTINFSKSDESTFDYYMCRNTKAANKNVKFVIANDYNIAITDSIKADDTFLSGGNKELASEACCVRFSYNSVTNDAKRAYLRYSNNSNFLNIVANEAGKVYNEAEGSTDLNGAGGTTTKMSDDDGNFVYRKVVYAKSGSQIGVQATYNSHPQTFVSGHPIITSSSDSKLYPIRVVYDFKTNNLTTAWYPGNDEVTEAISNVNYMYIRNGQNAADQLTFDTGGSLSTAKVCGVMQFDYDNYVGKVGAWPQQAGQATGYTYKTCMFYISFPFNVKVSDIFGIGTYGKEWKLQYYDGAERAKKGFFRGDGTTTFWKDMTLGDTLKAWVGYSLLLDNDYYNTTAEDMVFNGKKAHSSVYLYFPSYQTMSTVARATTTITVPSHLCTLPHSWTDGTGIHYHSNTDSHWNMLGVPVLNSNTGDFSTQFTQTDLHYLYAWDAATNTLNPAAADAMNNFTFNAMGAYMVQFTGDITFTGALPTPASVAARHLEEKKNSTVDLEVQDGENARINHTYIELREGASDDFELNEDMYMSTNSKAVNIYSFAGAYDVAANVLSLQNQTVKVGVIVKKSGTYTFSMPSNFDGTVTLIDKFAQTRTNLALEDYEVALPKGTINDRFELELNIRKVPTAIDGVTDGSGSLKDGKAHKFIENGAMYILREGQIYDARGNKVK